MQEYRANIMGLDGHIELRMVLICKDETEAKKRARCLADGYDVELWFEDRKIAEFKSEKTSLSWQPARHPATARERPSIAEILGKLEARRIAVFLCGLRTQSIFGDEYKNAFAAMFSGLASEHNVLFYPAFDDAFVDNAQLKALDGLHPNPARNEAVVTRMLSTVEALIGRARRRDR